MKRVALIAKGNSSRARRKLASVDTLIKGFPTLHVEVCFTKYPGHARNLAEGFVKKPVDYLIACGGDGTAHEVLNGMLMAPLSPPVFGVFPIGSANDFARGQHLSNSLHHLFQAIEKDNTQLLDVGITHFHTEKGTSESAFFLNICEIGFGPEAVKKVNAKPHFFPPDLSFLLAITQTFFTYSPQHVTLTVDDSTWEGKLLIAGFANSTCLGGGIYLAPEAKINDRLLHVTRIGNVSAFDYLTKIGKLKKGETLTHPKIDYSIGKNIKATSPHPIAIEADGEFLGYLPAEIELHAEQLYFLDTKMF